MALSITCITQGTQHQLPHPQPGEGNFRSNLTGWGCTSPGALQQVKRRMKLWVFLKHFDARGIPDPVKWRTEILDFLLDGAAGRPQLPESTGSFMTHGLPNMATCYSTAHKGWGQQPSKMGSAGFSFTEGVIEELADGFTYAINWYQVQEHQARKTIQCQCWSESSEDDTIEVLDHGPHYTTNWVRVQVHQADNHVQCWSEVSNKDIVKKMLHGFNYSTSLDQGKVHPSTDTIQCSTQCVAELTLHLREACRMRAFQENILEKVTASMARVFPGGNIPHFCSFRPVHPAFSRAQQFLDDLFARSHPPSVRSDVIKVFTRCGDKEPYYNPSDTPEEQIKKAIASVMGTWPDQEQCFGQPLHFPWLILKQAFVQEKHAVSHLVHSTQSDCVELEHLEPTEAELEEPPPELQSTQEPEKGPSPGLEPGPAVPILEPVTPPSTPPDMEQEPTSTSAPGPALEVEPPGPPALIFAPTSTELASAPAPSFPRSVTTENLGREGKCNILTFPPRLVAEQLTAMDVELFKKVLPYQCLGSIWSQRDKPGNEHMASTVRATITQFNSVAACVITTCLGDPSMRAQDRAKVLNHWIKVARECRSLRNFSSLHGILSALQSVSIYRLKKTWEKVSRKSRVTLKKLCKEDNPASREQLMKKRPSRLVTLMLTLCGAQKRLQQKCVPFLGKFLTDLQMLDTVMEHYMEGSQSHKENQRKELEVMQEIVELQEAAENYEIEPEEQFRTWFRTLEQLSEKESYLLSCQLEPQS